MNAQIFSSCADSFSWNRCLLSAVLALLAPILQAESDPAYWLLLSLYSLDFFLASFVALVSGEFEQAKMMSGLRKLAGYLFLLVPLLLAGHYLDGSPQEQIYEYAKNWTLFYMSAIEAGSIGGHLSALGVPVPDVKKLRRFAASVSKLTGEKNGHQ